MRLFTGIAVSPQVAAELSRFTDQLRLHGNLRWNTPEKLHITTTFIGEWPAERLAELQETLKQVASGGGIPVQLSGISWMPSYRFARFLYASAGPHDPLRDLAQRTAEALQSMGIEPEKRAYRPHVTLAWVKERTNLTSINNQLKSMDTARLGAFDATSFHLYQSADGKYSKLAEYPL